MLSVRNIRPLRPASLLSITVVYLLLFSACNITGPLNENVVLSITNKTESTVDIVVRTARIVDADGLDYDGIGVGDIDPNGYCGECGVVDGRTLSHRVGIMSGDEYIFITRLSDTKEIISFQMLNYKQLKKSGWQVKLHDERQ